MNIFDSLLSLLTPHECVDCGAEGRLLCAACRQKLPPSDKRCYKCNKPGYNMATCAGCQPATPLASIQSATLYSDAGKALLVKLKFGRAVAAATEIADIIADRLGLDPAMAAYGDIIICHAPTATGRIRQRGYDQSQLVARALARRSGIPYHQLLFRRGQRRQMGSDRRLRHTQLVGLYQVTTPRLVKSRRVLLVDDVATTGSSLEAAAAALRAAGATRIDGIVFAKA